MACFKGRFYVTLFKCSDNSSYIVRGRDIELQTRYPESPSSPGNLLNLRGMEWFFMTGVELRHLLKDDSFDVPKELAKLKIDGKTNLDPFQSHLKQR
jgi:hypothetical protein